jgi:hypothetical protein
MAGRGTRACADDVRRRPRASCRCARTRISVGSADDPRHSAECHESVERGGGRHARSVLLVGESGRRRNECLAAVARLRARRRRSRRRLHLSMSTPISPGTVGVISKRRPTTRARARSGAASERRFPARARPRSARAARTRATCWPRAPIPARPHTSARTSR